MAEWHISTVQQMRLQGWGREQLREAVQSGTLYRVRRGYYCTPNAPRPLVHAVRVGGRATGTTALPHLGVWTPPDERIHVLVPENAARLREPDHRFVRLDRAGSVHVHWTGLSPNKPTLIGFRPYVDVRQALIDTIRCSPPDLAAGAVDSALHLRRVTDADLALIRAALPVELHSPLLQPNPQADQGWESVVAYRLRRLGLRVEIQVVIPRLGRVDLLIEGRLILELDGRAYHDNGSQFAEDRRRDLEAALQHYGSMRLTYAQIFGDWAKAEAGILAALA